MTTVTGWRPGGKYVQVEVDDKRPWVGLTDDEIVYLSKTVGNGIINDGRFARAIEAKLKEKNK